MHALINQERLSQISNLKSGNHEPNDIDMCTMEAVAYVAGEPWSDAPQCACPVITKFIVSWNDSLLSDADRNRLLKDLIPKIVGTRSSKEIEDRRSYMAVDWLIRVYTPHWIALIPSLDSYAKTLRGLDVINNLEDVVRAGKYINDIAIAIANTLKEPPGDSVTINALVAAMDEMDAARKARDATQSAGWTGAWFAARMPQNSDEWAAIGSAICCAAHDVATTKARLAANSSTWEIGSSASVEAALKPTTEWLQESALRLVHAMIDIETLQA